MEPRAHYFIVGLFVIGLCVTAVLGVLWLSADQRKIYHTYLTYMDESVSGLNVQAPVKFNGVNVGFVSAMKLNPSNPQQVRILLNIEEGTPINQSTRATLMTQGITGVMFISLKAGATSAPSLEKKPEEPYPIIPYEPSVLVELGTTLRKMTDNMRIMSEGFHKLLDEGNQKAIQDGLKNLNLTLLHTQVTLDNFSQQLLPSVVNTMSRLDRMLNRTESLVGILQDNPSALVRGKAPAAKGPGE